MEPSVSVSIIACNSRYAVLICLDPMYPGFFNCQLKNIPTTSQIQREPSATNWPPVLIGKLKQTFGIHEFYRPEKVTLKLSFPSRPELLLD